MPDAPQNPSELGYYITLAQVGMEMAAPAGLGFVLDHYLGWRPWGVIGGAILGLIAGLAHLVSVANQQGPASSKSRRERK